MVATFLNRIKKAIQKRRVKKAIQEANQLAVLTGRRYYVIMHTGKPRVWSKQDLKRMVAQKKFVKGFTVADLEKLAIHTTLHTKTCL